MSVTEHAAEQVTDVCTSSACAHSTSGMVIISEPEALAALLKTTVSDAVE